MWDLPKQAKNNPFVRGLPFIIFVTMGFYGLTTFIEGKKELEEMQRGKRTLTQRQYDIEEEYKSILKKITNDPRNAEVPMIPIQRPKDE